LAEQRSAHGGIPGDRYLPEGEDAGHPMVGVSGSRGRCQLACTGVELGREWVVVVEMCCTPAMAPNGTRVVPGGAEPGSEWWRDVKSRARAEA
jgi:hypothetical protein